MTDENFTPKMAQLLSAFDRTYTITPLTDHFARSTPDVDWMRGLSTWDPAPAVLCGDGRILRNRVERTVLKEADLMFVYLASGWTNIPWPVQAWKIIKVWPDIIKEVSRSRDPSLIEITVKLKVDNKGPISRL